jgi:hypothetical protein
LRRSTDLNRVKAAFLGFSTCGFAAETPADLPVHLPLIFLELARVSGVMRPKRGQRRPRPPPNGALATVSILLEHTLNVPPCRRLAYRPRRPRACDTQPRERWNGEGDRFDRKCGQVLDPNVRKVNAARSGAEPHPTRATTERKPLAESASATDSTGSNLSPAAAAR